MRSWKIPMPKEAPRESMTHFAFALKDANGQRVEFTGQADAREVAAVLQTLIAARKGPLVGASKVLERNSP